MTPHAERVADLVRQLGVWCQTFGHELDACGRVSEATAAEILGRSAGTLRNWRAQLTGPPYYRSTPVRYALRDLAVYIESTRLDHEESRIVTTRHGAR